MKLNDLHDDHPRKKRRRVGRGIGSGCGKTAGRGGKGQTARSGVRIKGFEGGQMPIHRRLPKRGFTGKSEKSRPSKYDFDDLNRCIEAKKIDPSGLITDELLFEVGLIRRPFGKLLANGKPYADLQIETYGASVSAIRAIEKAGGTVTVTKAPATLEVGRMVAKLPGEKGDPPMKLFGSIKARKDKMLDLVVSIEAQPSEQDMLFELEFVIDAKDSRFETQAFGLKQMTSKRSEHKLVYEIRLVGETSGPKPSVDVITVYRHNYVGSQHLRAKAAPREIAL